MVRAPQIVALRHAVVHSDGVPARRSTKRSSPQFPKTSRPARLRAADVDRFASPAVFNGSSETESVQGHSLSDV